MNILFLVNELLIVCGVTKHLYHLLSGLKEKYPDNKYIVITGGGNALDMFVDLGINVIVNENIRHESRSVFKYYIGIKNIYFFVRNNDIDIVHSHYHYAASIASKVSKFTNVKTILTNHGILPEVGILNHFDAHHIIAVNPHVEEYILKNKIKKGNEISLIPYGFPTKDLPKSRNEKIKIITGGRFVKEKGFDIYLSAVANLPDHIKQKAEFFLAGAGSEVANLLELNTELSSGVVFLGPIENFQSKLYETDIFVMPTISKAEGFPTVLIEAGIAKNLIITSNFIGYDSVLSENNSLIFEVGDGKQLGVLLAEVIVHYSNYSFLSENFHKITTSLSSQDKMVVETHHLYQKLIG